MSLILHLVDDEKVINRTVDFFERALPEQNIFLCFCKKSEDGSYVPRHVNADKAVYFYDGSVDVFSLDFDITKVIVHALYDYKVSFINKYIPVGVPVCWIVWGYDLYGQILDGMGYHLYPLCNSKITFREWLNNRVKGWIKYSSKQSEYFCSFISKRVTSISCCDGDYDLMRRYHVIGDIPRVDFFYYPIKDVLGRLYGESLSPDANVIMCGNSAAETNNHEYLLRRLHRINIKGKNVVFPLSYCGSPKYVQIVEDCGRNLFGDNFVPITDFLPLDEYNKLFIKAGICIYASWRQMAVGNILVALYLGSKVYLSKRNPWLKDAHRLGLIVFVLEEAVHNSFMEPLSEQDRLHNKCIIEQTFSSKRLVDLIQTQFA